MANWSGKYKHIKSENLDDYMKEIGVDIATRTAAKAWSPDVEYKVEGDTYHIITSGLKSHHASFKLGVEQEEKAMDGRAVKSTYTLDGNTLTQIEKDGKGESKIVRVFNGDDLTVTITRGNLVATRQYKKA
ncbi:fatty acid-binding protein-like isoform X1 [Artemia franciscana]|uniref:fatty acid-binding protein-like isoform X1 n=1 Tax=Artemia franciscana TaxID=6661 RepID=UPI0032DA9D07